MQDDSPLVSVVTSLYNHKAFLKRRVDSILRQTLPNFEWIIIDDCSTDGSFEYCQELTKDDHRVVVLRNTTNQGFTYTCQRGFDLAKGKYLYRADSDDCCTPEFLAKMCHVLDSNPQVGLAYCRGLYLDAQDGYWGGIPKKPDALFSGWEVFRRLLTYGNDIKTPAILLRKQIVDVAGGFALLPLLCNSDWHLSLRVCLLSDVAFIDERLAYYRIHTTNISRDRTRQLVAQQMEYEFFALMDDALARVPSTHEKEVIELRQAAYAFAANSLKPTILWARQQGYAAQADELERMVRKYVPDVSIIDGPNRLLLKLPKSIANKLIKLLSYRRLSPI